MLRITKAACFICALLLYCVQGISQEPVDIDVVVKKADRFRMKATEEASQISEEMLRISGRFEKKLSRYEKILAKYINKKDSLHQKANMLLTNPLDKSLLAKLSQSDSLLAQLKHGPYLQRVDSLQSMLGFLKGKKLPVNDQLDQLLAVKNRLGIINDYQEQLKQRQLQWLELLKTSSSLSNRLPKSFVRIQTDILAYKAKWQYWKEVVNNPAKIEQEALRVLTKIPAFQEFIQKNSELASLFGIPSNSSSVAAAALPGLQTSSTLSEYIQTRMGNQSQTGQMIIDEMKATAMEEGPSSDANNPFSQLTESVDKAKQQLNSGGTVGNPELSPGQLEKVALKSKGFKKRLEFTWNMQTGQRVRSFPVTNDLGLSLGYKILPKAVAGIGASYKFGLGSWQKISLTHEGMSIRSFFDWRISSPNAKLMANFWITAGYELNYWERIRHLQDWRHLAWQKSGLIGITKKISINKKEIKMQFLYDYLNQPSQSGLPFLFRYNSTF